MKNLTDIHNSLSAADRVYLEKRAEQIKIAEEEDAAGRIMARGFADELSKLAMPGMQGYSPMAGGSKPAARPGQPMGGPMPAPMGGAKMPAPPKPPGMSAGAMRSKPGGR